MTKTTNSTLVTESQRGIFRTAYLHFQQASGVLNETQFLRNTAKRLQGAGLPSLTAIAQAARLTLPDVELPQRPASVEKVHVIKVPRRPRNPLRVN